MTRSVLFVAKATQNLSRPEQTSSPQIALQASRRSPARSPPALPVSVSLSPAQRRREGNARANKYRVSGRVRMCVRRELVCTAGTSTGERKGVQTGRDSKCRWSTRR